MSPSDLNDRVALITGAAGGIGQALARAFVAAGLRVALCDTAKDGLRLLQGELGAERTIALPLDVSDPAACRDSVARTIARFGRLDVLVNNAAIGMSVVREDHMRRVVQIEDITPELWARFMAVNLSGPFNMAHAAVPGMRAQKFGRIINVTTSFFTMLNPGFSPYGPAKSGLEAWSASLAGELLGTGITVNVVVPGGPTDTPMVPDDGSIERSQMIRPQKMAPPMLHLASDAGSAVTGMRFVAAEWDAAVPVAEAMAASGAPAGWPELARSPVWPGGGPKRG
ncbi:MAG: SDR family oxidoreductase [Reyranella sp.]|jgi:NAD(P)-dependent dehydrogenase (short-subunit alcohol dehydrogenase family)|nr:SDR family oxidoreductase [Reyranella sp.]MBL6651781.1 SDR family oxidoreductase [Reyranella sp.]